MIKNTRVIKKIDASEKVLKALQDTAEPLKAGQIAKVTGLGKKDIDKAIKALKGNGRIVPHLKDVITQPIID